MNDFDDFDLDELADHETGPRPANKWAEQSVTAEFVLTLDTILSSRDGQPYTVGDAIIDAAAERLAVEAKRGEQSGYGYRDRVHQKVEALLNEKATELIDQLWQKQVVESDRFGAATGGEPMSLEAWAAARIEKWLKEDSGDYNRRTSRLAKAISDALDVRLKKELDAAIAAAKQQALAAVTKVAEDHLTKALRDSLATAARP